MRDGGGGKKKKKRGLVWNYLPVIQSKNIGRIGPGFGYGAGCGFGVGVGLLGGAGLGAGFPGLRLSIGIGAGCGIGLGFGYGVGRGVAYDENRRYTNVGELFGGRVGRGTAYDERRYTDVGNLFRDRQTLPSQEVSWDKIDALFEELNLNTKKLIKATSREIEKWR